MRFIYALLWIICIPFTIHAQVNINSFSELLTFADAKAPAAQQAKLQPLAARQDVNIQASGLYPKVNAFATGDYYPIIPTQVIPAEILGGAPGTYFKAQFGLPYVFTAGADISMPVINMEKWAQVAKSKVQYSQSQWSSKVALENLHMQLLQTYYQSLVTGEVQKLNKENEETTDELLRIMSARNESGVLNPSDFNRSKNLQLDVQSSLIGYDQQLKQSRNNIYAVLNMKQDSLRFTEDIAQFAWPNINEASDASRRPAWQEADYKLQAANLSLSESKRGGLPRLSMAGRYAYNMQSQFDNTNKNVEFSAANIGLRLDVPLFQGNYYRSMQYKNNILLKTAQLEQDRTRATLSQQEKDWHTLYEAAYNKHTVVNDKVQSASDNLRIARLNLKEGVMEFDEFNTIFMEYNKARMEYLQNLADGILYYLLSTQNL
jgi:outer membrane protein TolC